MFIHFLIYCCLVTFIAAEYSKGIDISHWNGNINWAQVASDGVEYVAIKMTEGGTYTDPKFTQNYQNAKANGINVKVYHYFRALTSTSEEQFKNIERNLKNVNGSFDALAIDVETRGNEDAEPDEMADVLYGLLELIYENYNVRPMIYCSPSIWENKVEWEKYDFSVYPLWIANWNVTEPIIPSTWKNANKTWVWWQHSSTEQVNGISGNVDLDYVKSSSNDA